MKKIEEALEELEIEYEFSSTQLELLKTLYDRRINSPTEPVYLSETDIQLLASEGNSNITVSLELLEAVNIKVKKNQPILEG